MKKSKRTYYKGIEELSNSTEFVKNADKEFLQPAPEEDLGHSRRDFLKMMGFGLTAVTLAACQAPIRKAIPYINKPMDTDASNPNYYASTYTNGGDYCSIVIKTREGRPIKLSGNSLSGVTGGGVNAQVEASVLSLYDNARLRGPKIVHNETEWDELDKQVVSRLQELATLGAELRIISNSILSPSTKSVLATFLGKYPKAQHIMYDPGSCYAMTKANEESFGTAMIPSFDFSKAAVIVGIEADFLGTWLAPIEFTRQYAETRKLNDGKKDMSRHYQVESLVSVTGANADYRTQLKHSEIGPFTVQLYNIIATNAGRPTVSGGADHPDLKDMADQLLNNKGKALVVCGTNDPSLQVLVNGINDMLGSYGTTILPQLPVNYRQGNDEAMAEFVSDLSAGKIGGVIFYNCNPVYDHPQGEKIAEALKNIHLSLCTNYKEDETGSMCAFLAPDHHYLEAWNDAEPKKNQYSLAQPGITPVFKTRAAQESFTIWAQQPPVDYFDYLKGNWEKWFFKTGHFQQEWDRWLYNGVNEMAVDPVSVKFAGDVDKAAAAVATKYKSGSDYEVVLYESVALGNGSQANNPLLQELPDPITKAVWDHYITVSQKDTRKLGVNMVDETTRMGKLTINGSSYNIPVVVQPGQTEGTIGLAIGYGRTKAGLVADGIGFNVYPFASMIDGAWSFHVAGAKLEITDEDYKVARTQTHQTYMKRDGIVYETTLADYLEDPGSGHEPEKIKDWRSEDNETEAKALSMWKGHEYYDHHWGMAIDLNSCTGCAACVVACNVENNIALVGRDEVIRRREMHWLRIDRYYSTAAAITDWKGLEVATDNPEIVFQPMLCQQCNNAPCETVCPVAATSHSSEGLNQMVYNRCIGTRYCANNCPYKVRRFNWWKYHDNDQFLRSNPEMNTELGKMVLNPEVTVRSRGVMEKCTFCVQRIQAGKLTAKREKRKVADGEIVTACQAACTGGAILFGDMNDPESKISKLLGLRPSDPKRPYGIDKDWDNPRAYRVLEEIDVKPNIYYLTKVRNKKQENA